MYDVLDIIKNIQSLYENNSSLAVLKDFERVLDELDVYVYDNWEDGEIAYGPKIDRHWITVGIMWPQNKMPDPTGGKRLTDIGCKVKYQKSHLVEPRPIKSRDDLRVGAKKGKLDRHPVWIVEIHMPKKIAFDMYDGYMAKMKKPSSSDKQAESAVVPSPVASAGATPAQLPPSMAAAPNMAPPMSGGM
jgi:hypothetical protein